MWGDPVRNSRHWWRKPWICCIVVSAQALFGSVSKHVKGRRLDFFGPARQGKVCFGLGAIRCRSLNGSSRRVIGYFFCTAFWAIIRKESGHSTNIPMTRVGIVPLKAATFRTGASSRFGEKCTCWWQHRCSSEHTAVPLLAPMSSIGTVLPVEDGAFSAAGPVRPTPVFAQPWFFTRLKAVLSVI